MALLLPSDSIQDITEISPIWRLLTPEQQQIVNENLKIIKVKKNEIIYKEGDDPTFLLSSIKGKVKIYTKGIHGKHQIARIIKPHEFFGYRALFAEEKYVTYAAAFEPCIIYSIPGSIITPIIKDNAALSFEFIRFLSVDLGISDTRTACITQKNIQGRLAECLLTLKKYYGTEDNGETISIQLSREDLANLSNMTTSNAIRTLSKLASEGVIHVSGRTMRILKEKELIKISQT